MLFTTVVQNVFCNIYHKFLAHLSFEPLVDKFCSQLLEFTTVPHKHCSQHLFTIFYHIYCSQLLYTNVVNPCCSKFVFITFFTTFVQNFYFHFLFITVVHNFCLQLQLTTVVQSCCSTCVPNCCLLFNNSCSLLLYTSFVCRFGSTASANYFCATRLFKFLFITVVHEFCSKLCFTTMIHYCLFNNSDILRFYTFYSPMLFTNT